MTDSDPHCPGHSKHGSITMLLQIFKFKKKVFERLSFGERPSVCWPQGGTLSTRHCLSRRWGRSTADRVKQHPNMLQAGDYL